jgi:hypothetical protein
MNEKITKKEIVAFVLIVGAMLGCLVYGFFLLKENQKPTPTPLPFHTSVSCWKYYESQGEEVAIQMCEVGEGE